MKIQKKISIENEEEIKVLEKLLMIENNQLENLNFNDNEIDLIWNMWQKFDE